MDIFTELIRQLGKQLDLYNGIDSDDDNDNVNEDNVNEDNVNEDNVNDDNKSKLDTFIINTQPKNTQPENTPVYSKYTVINVGNGEPLPFKLPGGYKERYNDKLLITQSNIENKKDSKSFLHSFMNAYNNHLDMVLSPDDIWVFICLQFSAYVNDNADKIKHKFVNGFVWFMAIGLFTIILNIILLYIFTDFLRIYYVLSQLISLMIVGLLGFYLNDMLTFNRKK